MSFESFLKGAGQQITNTAENIKVNREARLRSPEFQKKLLESRNKIVEHLAGIGTHSFEAVFGLLLTAHLKLLGNSVKNIFENNPKESPGAKYIGDIQKGFTDVALAAKSAVFLLGRGSLHFGRWLLAR